MVGVLRIPLERFFGYWELEPAWRRRTRCEIPEVQRHGVGPVTVRLSPKARGVPGHPRVVGPAVVVLDARQADVHPVVTGYAQRAVRLTVIKHERAGRLGVPGVPGVPGPGVRHRCAALADVNPRGTDLRGRPALGEVVDDRHSRGLGLGS